MSPHSITNLVSHTRAKIAQGISLVERNGQGENALDALMSPHPIDSLVSHTRAKIAQGVSLQEEIADALDAVYVVLRPLNLAEAPAALLKGVGHVVKDFELENYLVLQHWGVLIGEHYYHLHIDAATNKLSVSMVPFIHDAHHEHHTIKFPIWRTRLTHDQRVGVAVGIIKAMGNYASEAEVEIIDEHGQLVTSPEDRARYHTEGKYRKPLVGGKYNALTNNCIHFTCRYVFLQILARPGELKYLPANTEWLARKWHDLGCHKSPLEVTKFLAGILFVNPFTFTPERGARVLIKLLSAFLNVEYNPVLDKKIIKEGDEPVDE